MTTPLSSDDAEAMQALHTQIDRLLLLGAGDVLHDAQRMERLQADWLPRALLRGCWIATPIGEMLAIADQRALYLLEFINRKALPREIAKLRTAFGAIPLGRNAILDLTQTQLEAYFRGVSADFTLPLAQAGTAFERAVWNVLREIPLGKTWSYSDIARKLARPDGARAVARANGANPLAIVVPCHRVIGADGAMTGYGGKIWRKRWLIAHEMQMAGISPKDPVMPLFG